LAGGGERPEVSHLPPPSVKVEDLRVEDGVESC